MALPGGLNELERLCRRRHCAIDHFAALSPAGDPRRRSDRERAVGFEASGKGTVHRIRNDLGELPIIAEDLALLLLEVEKLRDDFGFPGCAFCSFASARRKESRSAS